MGVGGGFVLCAPSPLIHYSSLGLLTPSCFTETSLVFKENLSEMYEKVVGVTGV